MHARKAVLAFGLAGLAAIVSAQAQDQRTVRGLQTPESAAIGADGRIYVSEIGGFGKDGDGRIVVVDAAGKIEPFATGMNDPKGLAVRGQELFVADKTRVLRVGPDGKVSVLAETSAFPQTPLFLNDVAFGTDGTLYVSDSGDTQAGGKGAIYAIAPDGKVTLVVSEAQNPAIKSPNGLLVEGAGRLLVADFSTGELLRLDLASKKTEKLAEGFGGGDGLALDAAGMLYITDWKGGKAWKLNLKEPGAKPQQYEQKFQAAADITLSTDGKFVLLPDMKAGTLHWLPK